MAKTYSLISLGCAKNQVDSERLKADLSAAGLEEADEVSSANFMFINTCGFIEPAKKEAIETIFDAVSVKEESSADQKLIVFGCLIERYREEFEKEIPEVDCWYGLYDERLAAVVLEHPAVSSKGDQRLPLLPGLAYEYIKISDGCSNNCSYCAIPLIRGAHRSFAEADILEDVRQAAARGARELIVVAQDITAYDGRGGLASLLEKICAVEGPQWVRLMYAHPDHVTDDFIQAMAGLPKIVPYLDIPFQHADADILRAMNRRGNADMYLDLVSRLRHAIPGIALRSTFMIGFPGETEKQFETLMDFIQKARLDRVGAFVYSPEEGTPAMGFTEKPAARVCNRRQHELMRVQQDISREIMHSRIGSTVEVLVEEKIDDVTWAGRSKYDAPEIDGVFYLTSSHCALHDIVTARVTDAVEYDLIGEA